MRETYFISVLIHILAAAVWTGGMIFLAIVLIPAIRNNPEKAMLIHSVGLKFRAVGWVALLLLLLTGLFNMHYRQAEFSWEGLSASRFGKLMLAKILIFISTVAVSAIHDFHVGTTATRLWIEKADPGRVKKFRLWARWAGRINLVLALSAIALGIALVRGL